MENIAFKPTIGRFSPFLLHSFWTNASKIKKKKVVEQNQEITKKKMDSEWRENGTGLHVPFMHQGIGDRIALISAREASSCVRNKKRLPLPRL